MGLQGCTSNRSLAGRFSGDTQPESDMGNASACSTGVHCNQGLPQHPETGTHHCLDSHILPSVKVAGFKFGTVGPVKAVFAPKAQALCTFARCPGQCACSRVIQLPWAVHMQSSHQT
ncbi:hypothetical protein ABBQ32_003761 [Trebouxia sp. C0010 RCD-2024]